MLSFLHDFLISRFSRKNKGCFIDTLSNDILVDHIFIYFTVEDILSLRRVRVSPPYPIYHPTILLQVSKLYYYLTHQPIIWKRFLHHINIPLPPLPPTSRYSLGQLAMEAERLVIRAISLDDNWRSFKPKLYRAQKLKAYSQVHAMKVLPGGKYLVASVDPGCRRYAIMVFVLDHAGSETMALAKTPTKSKAYNLQAKYMTFQGVQGIAIAYIRRKFKGTDRERCGLVDHLCCLTCFTDPLPSFTISVDPSDYSPAAEIDAPFPLQYECVCLHISLQALELLSDPEFPPGSPQFRAYAENQSPPFREIARIRSSAALESLSLVEHNGMPYVVFVQRPDKIVIKDLTTTAISTLKCEPFEPFSDLVSFHHKISFPLCLQKTRNRQSAARRSFPSKAKFLSFVRFQRPFQFQKQRPCTSSKYTTHPIAVQRLRPMPWIGTSSTTGS